MGRSYDAGNCTNEISVKRAIQMTWGILLSIDEFVLSQWEGLHL